jgi:hypothetical protein
MHYYETTHLDPGEEYFTTTAHDSLDDAISFADAHGCTYILEIGGSWNDFEKCSFCGDWFSSCEVDAEVICYHCRKAIQENNPEASPGDLRIVNLGTYDVQLYSMTILDGWAERDWHTIKSFTTEEEAKQYIKNLEK